MTYCNYSICPQVNVHSFCFDYSTFFFVVAFCVRVPLKDGKKRWARCEFRQGADVGSSSVIEFWCQKRDSFPVLWSIAVDILACPASTATVEWMFSLAGIACQWQWAKLSGKQLENEVMMQNNNFYL